jgi:hypothetical protein
VKWGRRQLLSGMTVKVWQFKLIWFSGAVVV